MSVAVLFARKRSVYFDLVPDVYDEARDARSYSGPHPVVAHPPCRGWGRLAHLAKVGPGELELARFAVDAVRRFGGVLEHPAGSRLWSAAGLPSVIANGYDQHGGWSLTVQQSWFGHRAPKWTWLYIVGVKRANIPALPLWVPEATGRIERMGVAERERTPVDFARWLVELAGRAQ